MNDYHGQRKACRAWKCIRVSAPGSILCDEHSRQEHEQPGSVRLTPHKIRPAIELHGPRQSALALDHAGTRTDAAEAHTPPMQSLSDMPDDIPF